MDLIHELSKLNVDIVLQCAFGEDISDLEMPYRKWGSVTQEKIPFVLRDTFQQMVDRMLCL
jgi:hypothetical protein